MTVMLDANVLIALVVDDHVHHAVAESWFAGLDALPWVWRTACKWGGRLTFAASRRSSSTTSTRTGSKIAPLQLPPTSV